MIPVIRRLRAHEAAVDAEAIVLVRSHDTGETAYKQARDVSRLARQRGDRDGARLYAKVAVRIAALTGRIIGKVERGAPRYVEPSREIEGDRTKLRT